MTEEKFVEEIKKLTEIGDLESHKKIVELVDKEIGIFKDNSAKKTLYEYLKKKSEIRIVEFELEALPETDHKNRIHLTGRIIKLYKKLVSASPNDKEKMAARYKIIELQEQQRELTKDYKRSNQDIKISEKLALTIKDISNAIDIFMNKKDVITKIKNIIKETGIGSIETTGFMVLIALISPLFGGVGFTLSMLANAIPVAGYIGLSSVIRNCLTKTEFQEYQYYQSEEYKEYVKAFKEENKTLFEELNSLIREKPAATNTEDKLKINEALISKIDEITNQIKDDGLRRTYELMALGFIRENKELCEEVIDAYRDEKNDDIEKYKEYNKRLTKINLELFKRGNSLKDALVHAGKQAGVSLAVMLISKAIITVMAPHSSYALKNINSLIIPLILAITNGIISIPAYTGKLKYQETKQDKEIEPKDKNKFEKLFGQLKLQPTH